MKKTMAERATEDAQRHFADDNRSIEDWNFVVDITNWPILERAVLKKMLPKIGLRSRTHKMPGDGVSRAPALWLVVWELPWRALLLRHGVYK